ncbi:hypothetical protein [Streptomyces sp. CoH27]|uniref:hypothetical protein n=1 Tax=Streptomyces sp. CoH27 TaxID=2875763 RepID=UPI0027E151DD|nr:hypothetical protein [Streptomyces sp. CoH27]
MRREVTAHAGEVCQAAAGVGGEAAAAVGDALHPVAGGGDPRDAQRCLKRNICRQIFKILEQTTRSDVEELPQAA